VNILLLAETVFYLKQVIQPFDNKEEI